MTTIAPYFVIGLFALLANLPFVSERWFLLVVRPFSKPLRVRLIEWAVGGLVALAIARWLEQSVNLQNYPQGGAFYWIVLIAYICMAMPGVIYRYLWLNASPPKPINTDSL